MLIETLALPLFAKLARDRVANVRFNVARALERLRPKLHPSTITTHAKPILRSLLDDKDRDAKFYAARAIAALDEPIGAGGGAGGGGAGGGD